MYDCRECGACCLSTSDAYVVLDHADAQRLPPERDLVRRVDGALHLRMTDGHCHALRIAPEGLVCSVYERRPAACRQLEAGSPACLAERSEKRRRALALLASARATPPNSS